MGELWTVHLGTVDYARALELQHQVRDARQAGEIPDTLLLLEHPPVYTRGRRSDPAELPLGADALRARGIDVVDVDRGGKVTYHGPGQLVGYPIARVDDVVGFVRRLEDAMVAALAGEGLEARSRSAEGRDFTGVWVEDRKVGAIGLHVARGVTTHGFAINVDNDLEPFSWVVPCGLTLPVTSIAAERGGAADVTCVRRRVAYELATRMGLRQRLVSEDALRRRMPGTLTSGELAPAGSR